MISTESGSTMSRQFEYKGRDHRMGQFSLSLATKTHQRSTDTYISIQTHLLVDIHIY